jgi:hypothetical protein
MKNDLKNSAIEQVEDFTKTLKLISSDIVKLTNYKSSLETKIIDFCEIYGIENYELTNLTIKTVSAPTKVPLKDLLTVFPNTDIKSILDNVVAEIKIDLNATEENLRFSGNLQEPIIKNIIKQLEKLSNTKVKKVVVK